MATTKDVKRLPSGRLEYRGETFSGYNQPKRSSGGSKKSVVLAKKGKIDRLNFSCTYGELSMLVLEVLLGATKATSGTGDAEIADLAITDASLPYFKIGFLIDDLQTSGDALATVLVTLQKCQLTGGSLVSGSTDSFNTPNFTAEAIKPAGDPIRFGNISFAETAASL